jgi:hypothetical protein
MVGGVLASPSPGFELDVAGIKKNVSATNAGNAKTDLLNISLSCRLKAHPWPTVPF